MKPTACITGITGQTGSYLAELLIQEGYKVFGLVRRSSSFNTSRIDHLYRDPHTKSDLELVYGDLSDYSSLMNFITKAKPELFFNLAAQSHVRVSFDIPEYTADVTFTGTLRCLEALRNISPHTRYVQASSSEMFGASPPPQNESTLFHPCSPYACSKVGAYYATINYREAYGLFSCNSISFNHESPRRGETFVTRKITRGATRIKAGIQDKLYLGNLQAARDWSHAKDVVNGIYKIIKADKPSDYVIATGEQHSVQEFVEMVFSKLGMNWKDYVEFDPKYLRPSEVPELRGDASKIKSELGWAPLYTFEALVDEMIQHDMNIALSEKVLSWNVK